MAKAFLSAYRMMITDIIQEAASPEPITRLLTEIYGHTPAVLHLHGRDLPIHPNYMCSMMTLPSALLAGRHYLIHSITCTMWLTAWASASTRTKPKPSIGRVTKTPEL